MSDDLQIRLRVYDLALQAGPLRLCEKLTFDLKTKEGLILRGPNGSGKTTLLRTLAGFNSAPQGEISLRLHDLKDGNDDIELAGNCHYFGHKNSLKSAHTVRQNLAFFARFNGADISVIDQAATQLDLQSLLDLPVSVLSAGQTRRAAFARLIIAPRAVWLLDEPSAALDVRAAQIIEQQCEAHLRAGGIVIAATHLPFLEDYGLSRTLDLAHFRPGPSAQHAAWSS